MNDLKKTIYLSFHPWGVVLKIPSRYHEITFSIMALEFMQQFKN